MNETSFADFVRLAARWWKASAAASEGDIQAHHRRLMADLETLSPSIRNGVICTLILENLGDVVRSVYPPAAPPLLSIVPGDDSP